MNPNDAKPCQHGEHTLRCPVCGGEKFVVREYALRTVEDEMLRQPWAADQVKAYVCGQCRNLQWFAT